MSPSLVSSCVSSVYAAKISDENVVNLCFLTIILIRTSTTIKALGNFKHSQKLTKNAKFGRNLIYYAALPYEAALRVTPIQSVRPSVCHRYLENGKPYNVQT